MAERQIYQARKVTKRYNKIQRIWNAPTNGSVEKDAI